MNEKQVGGALRVLLSELVDYAGLFPPAGLAMGEAVRKYAEYRAGENAWALGRFVTPVARFAKFEAAFGGLPTQQGVWKLTALLGMAVEVDIAAVQDLNRRLKGQAAVDSVELKVSREREIRTLAAALPPGITAYCEVEPSRHAALLKAVRICGLRAKIRTGGVTPDAFPQAESIADFLLACAQLRVPFKATAGLHHPVRCERALSYEENAPRGVMHGFLNVFLASAMASEGREHEEIVTMLLDDDATNFSATEDAVQWRKRRFSLESLHKLRAEFAISFGSCSFEEPLSDLRELGIL